MASIIVADVEQMVERIAISLVPVAEMGDLVVDAIPRKVEGMVYTADVHVVALLEFLLQLATPLLPASSPALVLLNGLYTDLAAGLVPPAGSAVLKQIPALVAQVQAFLTASGFVPVSPAGKAVVAHIAAQAAVSESSVPGEPKAATAATVFAGIPNA